MATVYVEVDEKYKISNHDAKISIDAKKYDGQGGAYSFFINENYLGSNKEKRVGIGKNLNDKTITISATIKDKLEETNWTSIKIFIKEDDDIKKEYEYSKEAEKHLDTVQYLIKIKIEL